MSHRIFDMYPDPEALASTMFEGAYTLSFVGINGMLAQEWVNHNSPSFMERSHGHPVTKDSHYMDTKEPIE